MTAYDFKKIPELTAAEKKSPYARFYSEPMKSPAPEVLAAIKPGKQIDPSLALRAEDLTKLIMPGTLKVENGYCILPDGTSFSVIHTKMPGVTLEMEKFWEEWSVSSDYNYLNFKTWLPGMHFMHGNTIWEDLGWGSINLHLVSAVMPLEDSSWPKELNPNFYSIHGGSYAVVRDGVAKPYWATIVHYMTLDKQGLDVTTCVWGGILVINGTPTRMIDKAEKVDPEKVQLFTCHVAWEAARKAQLLPKVYAYSKTLKTK